MAIPTSRTQELAEIRIDETLCSGCGLCVTVCNDFGLTIRDNKVRLSGQPIFGCIACGHCMMVCPKGAITIQGRCTSPADLSEMPPKEDATTYSALHALLTRRRSMRVFKEKPVDKELIDQVIQLAQTAPMGLPPSDVHVLVLNGKEEVRAFSKDFCEYLEGIKWLVSDWFLTMMRPFWSKSNNQMFRDFIKPCIECYTEYNKAGKDVVTYDAPVALYFYGSDYSDPADSIIAATYAMLAAESLGLGTCMLGAIHPMIQYGKAAKKFREKHGIRSKSREGLFVIMGYPGVKYSHAIQRTFASVDGI